MKKDKKTRRKRCNHCGQLKPKKDVTYTINPYEEDINGKIIWEKICGECYQSLNEKRIYDLFFNRQKEHGKYLPIM